MYLFELIARLEREPADKVIRVGFRKPHSYRGYYEDLAFEPAPNVCVGDMLSDAKASLGMKFCGYKGGEYEMNSHTECWLAEYGRCGEKIGPRLLEYMLADEVTT